jgi:hypothetical protein
MTTTIEVTPVLDGRRPVGAWIVGPAGATYRPVLDVTRLAGTVLATAAAVTVAAMAVAAARRRSVIGNVTMGPGGWVSVKGAAQPPLRAAARRPWWARALRAQPAEAGAGRARRRRLR